MKVGIIVQARMGSTRLTGKVMKDLCGKPVIQHVIERLKQSKKADEIIIATTTLKQDDIIEDQAFELGVKSYRGSEGDVLSRYYHAARDNTLDIIVRITADCPLADPFIIDDLINVLMQSDYNLVANVSPDLSQRTFPRGLDAEVFTFGILEFAFDNAGEDYQREHVTPFIYERSDKICIYKNSTDYSKYRWTLDTEDDLRLIKTIYDYLYKGKHDFYFADVLRLFEIIPELAGINAHVEQKKLRSDV